MFRIFIAALLLAGSAAFPAMAQDADSSDAGALARLEEKLRQHPQIEAYVARAEASGDNAEGELGLPDPMLFVEQQNYPIAGSQATMQDMKSIGFKQEIPAFGVRDAKSGRLQAESRKTKLLGDYAFAAMKAKLIAALAERHAIDEQETLLDRQAALLASERASIKGRISADRAGVSQLSLSDADAADIKLMRADLEEKKSAVDAMLVNLVGEAPDIALPPIAMMAWKDDPDRTYPVAIAAQDIAMAQKDVRLREAEFNPKFEVQASYGRMISGDNAGTLMVGLSIPLWASESQQPRLDGAKAAARAAENDRDDVKRGVLEKLTALKAQIAASDEKIALLERKASLLVAAGGAQAREYEAGKAEFASPLISRREALSVRYRLAEEQAKRTALVADFNHYIVEDSHE
jgi:outer membrane protein TolC